METRSTGRLRSQVNSALAEVLRRNIVDIGDGRGIPLMDISRVTKELTEIVDKGMGVIYNFGYEDGVKAVNEKLGAHGGSKLDKESQAQS